MLEEIKQLNWNEDILKKYDIKSIQVINEPTLDPIIYINLNNGLETVKDFYTVERKLNHIVNYIDNDLSTHFYKIPEDKKNVKVLHGEKSTLEVDKIVYYLKELNENGYFKNN